MAANVTDELKRKVQSAFTHFDKFVKAHTDLPQTQKDQTSMKMMLDLSQTCANLIGAFNVLIRDNGGSSGG